ncbi:crossover junction endodeoxyribonuclease RuvC [Taylorella equigenitalis]|uniref:crossover junction endodeoxyribonuclease RuvC n=1 Tax=Taylorella equigenitalis TaxID=29575 RepID=UPI0003FE8CA1|nr:crossover junction endodeoxyribonuclease RuvC [Taylorella equigenitalis]ASY30898.1 crossover junction endodeoxyribonuclease RuvC [Taylorella equigenitalis]KOS59509.1 Holliday junction resolvase [Taylorella equigenitalis]WDU51556.1 crossover junction endodeoxyribonuclease RuvC [Taylorella equigenitalis]WDU53068.1 crossover junction endodeoxyribonuclease RuvC [Taylorella equigenitalis]WDU54529.1 crossover junction endodeoxyribonuclease RuvC [Taylorella equigenitalis]
MRIVGIDPGLRFTGYGVIEASKNGQLQYVASGTIAIPTDLPLYKRLVHIMEGVQEVIEHFNPKTSCIEEVVVNKNGKTTLLLGQARGAALVTLANLGLEVFEYPALQIKKSVSSNGRAPKEQVRQMVKYILNLNNMPSSDAADALACAITHAHMIPTLDLLKMRDLDTSHTARMKGGRIKFK